jgi:hypothetical protein
VSRHHMLPPIIYTPVPQPKKAENRPKIRRLQNKGVAESEDVGETEEAGEVWVHGATARAAAHSLQDPSTPIEGAERRIPSTTGKLSDDTLKELLLAQEQESAPVGGVAPAAKSEP